jgi:retrograde regulation protein 2
MMIARMYPAGIIEKAKPRVKVSASWKDGVGRQRDKGGIEIKFRIQKRIDDPLMLRDTKEELLRVIEKVGKRKNWIGGKEGWGMKVKVVVVEEDWEKDVGWEEI